MTEYFCTLPALGLAAALVWALWKGFEAAAKGRISPVVRFYALLLPGILLVLPVNLLQIQPLPTVITGTALPAAGIPLGGNALAPGMAEGGFSLDVFLPAAEILWMSAALGLFLFRLGKVVWLSRWLRRTARPSPEGEAALRRIAGEKCRTPVLCSDKIATPLTMGLFRPVILLPDREIDEKDMEYALLHEWQHCRCRDLWVKGFLFGAACIQWWNPLGWILVREGERLCEEACDQRVTGTMSREELRLYGLAILNLLGKNFPGTAALSGGGKNLERRLKQMMNGKATKKSILAAAILAALALGCGGTVLAASLVPEEPAPEKTMVQEKKSANASPEEPKLVEAESGSPEVVEAASEPEKVPDNGGFGDPKLVEAPASDSPDSVQAASEQEKAPDSSDSEYPKLAEAPALDLDWTVTGEVTTDLDSEEGTRLRIQHENGSEISYVIEQNNN